MKKFIPYIILYALVFNVLPVLPVEDFGYMIVILLFVGPLACLICGITYGKKYGFSFVLHFLVIVVFLPAIFRIYNSSALIYLIPYTICSVLGNLLGIIGYKRKQKHTEKIDKE